MQAAQKTCQKHLNHWRRKIAESRDEQAELPLALRV
jgi:hypothetical protein